MQAAGDIRGQLAVQRATQELLGAPDGPEGERQRKMLERKEREVRRSHRLRSGRPTRGELDFRCREDLL